MSNFVYRKSIQYYSYPSILTDDVWAMLVRTGGSDYNPVPDSDRYLSDIPSGARIANTGSLSGKTFDLGIFKASSTNFGLVAAGSPIQAIVLFHHTGVDSTSELFYYIDADYTGLPVTPDGVNVITIKWPTAGIFQV